jgi:hypothetical protein
MRLKQYLALLQNIVYSRQEITVERFLVQEVMPDREGLIEGRLRFWDESLLEFVEVLQAKGIVLVKTNYTYHYQNADIELIFRYDNAPHHPEVATFPHHKHTKTAIETATPPHLGDVLKEIDQILYESKHGA